MLFVDLFCGAGGCSEGARQAGLECVLAIDSWNAALAVHITNHPNCVHMQKELGGDVNEFVAFLAIPMSVYKLLQGFPVTYDMGKVHVRKLVGNSVSPILARAMYSNIMSQLGVVL